MRCRCKLDFSFVSAVMLPQPYLCLTFMIAFSIPLVAVAVQPQRIDVLQGSTLIGAIDPYTGSLTGAANYNYVQPSGSPVSGPATTAFQGRVFFYEGSDGLNFNVIFNTGALGEGQVNWTISAVGSTTDPVVRLTDDPAPPADQPELIESSSNFFTGAWNYTGNTDGGVIGPITGSAWTITVHQLGYSSDKDKGITSLRAFDDSGSSLSLNLNSGPTGQIIFRPEVVPEPATATIATVALTAFVVCFRGACRLKDHDTPTAG
jgi:hypothetical protein